MSRPLLGTQAADNAAWDEIAAALASTDVAIDGVVGRLDNDAAQDLVAAVTPVLVRWSTRRLRRQLPGAGST